MVKHLDALNLLANKSILVIGDLMLDEYHWCNVNRISPEAPVPICSINNTTLMPGGAGNVANNLQSLGGNPILVGTIGFDSSGDKLSDTLHKSNISTSHLIQSDDRPTILKSRVIAHHQHVIRLDRDTTHKLSRKTQNNILKKIKELIPSVDAVLLSDYGKGMLSETVIQKTIAQAKERNIPVIVDPKGTQYGKYRHATLITPNYSEFCLACKTHPKNESQIHQKAIQLKKRLHLHSLLITRSEKGMSIIDESNAKKDIPTRAKEVFDITGAGDTVIATITLCLAAGWTIEEACHFANYAAGIVVGKVGTSTTQIQEIVAAIENEK